jgi:hypothetical protein
MGIYINENNPLYTDEFVTEANSLLTQAKKAVAECDEDIRFRVDLVGLQIDYLRLLRTPQEAVADGTRDRVFEFVRKHNILLNEWQSVEETINIYNNTYANKQEI